MKKKQNNPPTQKKPPKFLCVGFVEISVNLRNFCIVSSVLMSKLKRMTQGKELKKHEITSNFFSNYISLVMVRRTHCSGVRQGLVACVNKSHDFLPFFIFTLYRVC